jgi:ADP-dependent NAD(P)H-hydrate dehydratase
MNHLTGQFLREMPLPALESGDKKARGQVFLIGGSTQVPGAILLAGEAALRAGAGRVRIATCKAHAAAMGIALPEAFILGLQESERGDIDSRELPRISPLIADADALLIGPGLTDQEGLNLLVRGILVQGFVGSLLFDARAIKSVRHARGIIGRYSGRIVLTPHGGEMAALLGQERAVVEAEPQRWALEAAATFGAVVAFKGARTFIAAPDGENCVGEGEIGLATSGSGDVLAGVIAGLLARGANPYQAACWGVHLHAEAGRRLAQEVGRLGFLARELLSGIPRAMDAI